MCDEFRPFARLYQDIIPSMYLRNVKIHVDQLPLVMYLSLINCLYILLNNICHEVMICSMNRIETSQVTKNTNFVFLSAGKVFNWPCYYLIAKISIATLYYIIAPLFLLFRTILYNLYIPEMQKLRFTIINYLLMLNQKPQTVNN